MVLQCASDRQRLRLAPVVATTSARPDRPRRVAVNPRGFAPSRRRLLALPEFGREQANKQHQPDEERQGGAMINTFFTADATLQGRQAPGGLAEFNACLNCLPTALAFRFHHIRRCFGEEACVRQLLVHSPDLAL